MEPITLQQTRFSGFIPKVLNIIHNCRLNQSDKLVHLQKQNKNQRIKTFFTVEATTRLGLSVIVYKTLK